MNVQCSKNNDMNMCAYVFTQSYSDKCIYRRVVNIKHISKSIMILAPTLKVNDSWTIDR